VQTIATTGAGVPALVDAIARFREHGSSHLDARRRARSEYRLRELVTDRFMKHLEGHVLAEGEFKGFVDRIAAREVDPYTAANTLLKKVLQSSSPPILRSSIP
jgi:LAO/AO transport system kinase